MVTFADNNNQVRRVSMSRHLLVQVRVYLESTLSLFDFEAISSVISRKTIGNLHIRRIKVANCALDKCACHQRDITIHMGE